MTRNVIIKRISALLWTVLLKLIFPFLIVELHYIICVKHVCTYDTNVI